MTSQTTPPVTAVPSTSGLSQNTPVRPDMSSSEFETSIPAERSSISVASDKFISCLEACFIEETNGSKHHNCSKAGKSVRNFDFTKLWKAATFMGYLSVLNNVQKFQRLIIVES